MQDSDPRVLASCGAREGGQDTQLSLPGHNDSRLTVSVTQINSSWGKFSLPLARWKMHLISAVLASIPCDLSSSHLDPFTQTSFYSIINVKSGPTCRSCSYANSAEASVWGILDLQLVSPPLGPLASWCWADTQVAACERWPVSEAGGEGGAHSAEVSHRKTVAHDGNKNPAEPE